MHFSSSPILKHMQKQTIRFMLILSKTLNYVITELTDENGGFFCGQDADSDGIEGKYYVFTPAEIYQVLGDNDGKIFL